MDHTETLPIAVVGAGAAGLLAALFAARSGHRVVLLEGTRDGGRKILISGGGRCNILPSVASPERYVTESSSNLLRKVLRSWPLREQVEFFERELGQPLVLEEASGKLFPSSNRARDVRDRLMTRVREAGATVWFDARVTGLRRGPLNAGEATEWIVELGDAPPLEASSVILATGGLSVPATGSDGTGLRLMKAMGHTVHDTYPALTPLTADPTVHADLAGVSLTVTITAPGSRPRFKTTGGFLFTHRGYSGPSVLDASHFAVRSALRRTPPGERQPLMVAWTTADRPWWDRELRSASGTVAARLGRRLPTRLAVRLLDEAGIPRDCTISQLRRDARISLTGLLTEYPLPWTGDEGYKKAEVTGGGVALGEIDPQTMESRVHPGLFLCGEILDAFGPIGGHNFMWAWATGRAAGMGASRRTRG